MCVSLSCFSCPSLLCWTPVNQIPSQTQQPCVRHIPAVLPVDQPCCLFLLICNSRWSIKKVDVHVFSNCGFFINNQEIETDTGLSLQKERGRSLCSLCEEVLPLVSRFFLLAICKVQDVQMPNLVFPLFALYTLDLLLDS